jgi:serine/threonine protein kinase
LFWSGTEGEKHVMVTNIMGPDLEKLFKFTGQVFTMKTILSIAIQVIDRLDYLHNKNFIHRNMRPENICVGHGKKQNIFHLIDFGNTKRFICP